MSRNAATRGKNPKKQENHQIQRKAKALKIPEMGKTQKTSQLQKEIHNEDTHEELMQLQPKREVEEYEKEDNLENKEEEQSFPDAKESAPSQGTVKWEKTRTSAREKKQPDWLGLNIMVTKVEALSNEVEESLPSVFEIQKSQNQF